MSESLSSEKIYMKFELVAHEKGNLIVLSSEKWETVSDDGKQIILREIPPIYMREISPQ